MHHQRKEPVRPCKGRELLKQVEYRVSHGFSKRWKIKAARRRKENLKIVAIVKPLPPFLCKSKKLYWFYYEFHWSHLNNV